MTSQVRQLPGRVLVVGGVGVDDAVYLPGRLRAGTWTQAVSERRSPGGSAATVAVALAGAGLRVTLAGAVGTDTDGEWLHGIITGAGVHPHLARVPGPSPRSLILVDTDGERTIVGLTADLLAHATDALPNATPATAYDLLVVPAWRPQFTDLLDMAHRIGARTVIGLRALADPALRADVAVGSERELGEVDLRTVTDRFPVVVVTRGAAGAYALSSSGRIEVAPVAVRAVDATGAGDAFLAGVVTGLARGATLGATLALAAAWGAAAATRLGTPAPSFGDVTRQQEEVW